MAYYSTADKSEASLLLELAACEKHFSASVTLVAGVLTSSLANTPSTLPAHTCAWCPVSFEVDSISRLQVGMLFVTRLMPLPTFQAQILRQAQQAGYGEGKRLGRLTLHVYI